MNQYSGAEIMIFIRSLLFFIFSITTIILFSLICLMARPFSFQLRYSVIRCFLQLQLYALKIICNLTYQVNGLENIKTYKNGIILSKHQSTWETFYLPVLFKNPAIILKRELLWIPCFGWGLAITDPIAINRSHSATAMHQILQQGKHYLEKGRWILIFPEGTRVPVGQIGRYHIGGAHLAAKTGYPVLPIAHDAGHYWPRHGFIKRPGIIQVSIGPAIPSQGKSPQEILSLAKDWIEKTVICMHPSRPSSA